MSRAALFASNMLQHETNELLEKQNEILKGNVRESLIEEMINTGMLLPEYDWQDKDFQDKLESNVASWCKRHPDVKRGSGEFDTKYPEKKKALDTINTMVDFGRITPTEYIALHKEILNF